MTKLPLSIRNKGILARRLPPAAMRAMRAAGMSYADIAREAGATRQAVALHARRLGAPPLRRAWRASPVSDALLRRLYADGEKLEYIAAVIGYSDGRAANRRRKALGIPPRAAAPLSRQGESQ